MNAIYQIIYKNILLATFLIFFSNIFAIDKAILDQMFIELADSSEAQFKETIEQLNSIDEKKSFLAYRNKFNQTFLNLARQKSLNAVITLINNLQEEVKSVTNTTFDATTEPMPNNAILYDPKTAIFSCIWDNNIDSLKKFVDADTNHACLCLQNNKNETPLMFAIKQKHIDIVKFLLNYPESFKYGIPLHVATTENNLDIISMLLEKNVAINQLNEQGESALLCAVRNNYTEAAQLLINNNANPNNASKDPVVSNPLYEAVQNKNKEIVGFLLDKQANPNILYNQKTPLSEAIRLKYESSDNPSIQQNLSDIIQLLLNANADVNLVDSLGHAERPSHGFVRNNPTERQHPLYSAVKNNDAELVEQLMDKNANPNFIEKETSNPYEKTPLFLAIHNGSPSPDEKSQPDGNIRIIASLLNANNPAQVESPNPGEDYVTSSALHVFLKGCLPENYKDIFQLLIQHGGSVLSKKADDGYGKKTAKQIAKEELAKYSTFPLIKKFNNLRNKFASPEQQNSYKKKKDFYKIQCIRYGDIIGLIKDQEKIEKAKLPATVTNSGSTSETNIVEAAFEVGFEAAQNVKPF